MIQVLHEITHKNQTLAWNWWVNRKRFPIMKSQASYEGIFIQMFVFFNYLFLFLICSQSTIQAYTIEASQWYMPFWWKDNQPYAMMLCCEHGPSNFVFVQHEIAILQHKMWGEGNANFNTCNYNKFLYFNIDTKEHACFAMKSIISASVILLPGFLTTKAMGICPASSSGYLLENKPNCWEFHIAEQPWLINLIPIEALSRQAHYKHYEKL